MLDNFGVDDFVPAAEVPKTPPRSPSSSLPTPPRKKQKYGHIRRRARREKIALEFGQRPSIKTLQKHLATATGLKADVDTEALPSCRGAYRAKNQSYAQAGKKYTVADLTRIGFTLVRWDGKYVSIKLFTVFYLTWPQNTSPTCRCLWKGHRSPLRKAQRSRVCIGSRSCC
jgi:hypothetical protein